MEAMVRRSASNSLMSMAAGAAVSHAGGPPGRQPATKVARAAARRMRLRFLRGYR